MMPYSNIAARPVRLIDAFCYKTVFTGGIGFYFYSKPSEPQQGATASRLLPGHIEEFLASLGQTPLHSSVTATAY